ncbi:MAG: GatB/YqeY domain-containing protein [Candidatus Saccharibacteria bacterium]
MSLQNLTQLEADLASAAKARDQIRLSVLRLLKSALKNYEIEVGHDATPQEIMTVLQREAKKRQDSINQYGSANRQDLVDEEQAELEILEEYLPPKLSDEDLDKLVAQAIQETAASSPADMGKVMQAVMKLAGAGADGKVVSEKVKSALS